MTEGSIAAALQQYFSECEKQEDYPLRADRLPQPSGGFSIDVEPSIQIVQQYASTSTLRRYLFVLRSVDEYAPDVLSNFEKSALYEQLEDWLEQQTKQRHLPDLGARRTACALSAQSSQSVHSAETNTGHWQIQCQLIYFQKGDRV